jgi:cell division protein FtsB
MPVLTIAFLSYFGYHSLNGSFGLKATEVMEQQRVKHVQELALLNAERIMLENEVRLLSDGSLDKDMLDEQARAALNMSRDSEIVIFH